MDLFQLARINLFFILNGFKKFIRAQLFLVKFSRSHAGTLNILY